MSEQNIVFIGNVDAGKSTLCGQLLKSTLDARMVEKIEKEAEDMKKSSYKYAFILDTDETEREKGITVDISKYKWETPKGTQFTIIDAPGHQYFVPRMIVGASMADIAILVVSCKNGEYERSLKGQTFEHALLSYTIGISKLIVAINKMDIITTSSDNSVVEWNMKRYEEIVTQLSSILKNIGYKVKKDVIFLPISAYNNINLFDTNKSNLFCKSNLECDLKLVDKTDTNKSDTNKSLTEILDKLNEEFTTKTYENKMTYFVVHDNSKNSDETTEQTLTCRIIDKLSNSSISKLYYNNSYETKELINFEVVEQTNNTITFQVRCDYNFKLYDVISKSFDNKTTEGIIYKKYLVKLYICTEIIITRGYLSIFHLNGNCSNCEIKEIYDTNKKKKTFAKNKETVYVKIETSDYLMTADYENLKRVTLRNGTVTVAIGRIEKFG